VIFQELKKTKYFPNEMKRNLTQIRPTKTNRASMEHKVVLILTIELTFLPQQLPADSKYFSGLLRILYTVYMMRGDMNNCFVGDRDIIFQSKTRCK
jgi:hypothetical protein